MARTFWPSANGQGCRFFFFYTKAARSDDSSIILIKSDGVYGTEYYFTTIAHSIDHLWLTLRPQSTWSDPPWILEGRWLNDNRVPSGLTRDDPSHPSLRTLSVVSNGLDR